jgi:hypothetical protein
MFHKQYYKLEEAAKKLGVDIETLLSMEFEGSLSLSYVHVPIGEEDYWIETTLDDVNNKYINNLIDAFSIKYLVGDFVFKNVVEIVYQKITDNLGSEPCKEEVIEAVEKTIDGTLNDSFLIYASLVESQNDLGDSLSFNKTWLEPYTPYQLSTPHVQRVIHEDGSVMVLNYVTETGEVVDEKISQRPSKWLVVTNKELTRLLTLKAQQDGKPTLEQLQQELDAAKARIAYLEAKPIEQEKREQALLFWVEGAGRDKVLSMTKTQIHETLKKIDLIFEFKDFDTFWQKQQIIKLERGRPSR